MHMPISILWSVEDSSCLQIIGQESLMLRKQQATALQSEGIIMKHTKGEWKIVNDTMIFGQCVGGCQMKEDSFLIAEIRGWGHLQYLGGNKGFEIQKANAHVIAAAPDLLKACKAAQIMLLQTNWNGDDRLDIVHNAITKAEGN